MTAHRLFTAIVFIFITEMVGFLSSFATASSLYSWYESLEKPSFTPPNELFGPVWTVLYFLMGYAAFIVYDKAYKTKRGRIALALFWMQLGLNGLWSIVFFGLHFLSGAFVEIVFLWVFILFTLLRFYRISSFAGNLLVPYLLWITFAAVLNFAIVILN